MNGTEKFNFDTSHFRMAATSRMGEFGTRYIKPIRHVETPGQFVLYQNAAAMAKEMEIAPGCRCYAIVDGLFIFGDFIEALIVEHGLKVKYMLVSTLGVNENNIDSLALLLDLGHVKQLDMILSGYFYSHERYNLVEYAYKELDKNNRFQMAICDSHCKIVLIETECGMKLVVHGSANFRSSDNLEQFHLEENPQLYDFNFEYQQRILSKYQTIRKALRRKKLWNAVINKISEPCQHQKSNLPDTSGQGQKGKQKPVRERLPRQKAAPTKPGPHS
jgi:hypothetical protein